MKLAELGIVGGYDITTESAVAKLMFLLGSYTDTEQIKSLLQTPLRGEMTI
jgi:L-asparaginase